MTVMLERPTIISVPPGSLRFQALCRTLLTMDVPVGYRAEIVGGNIDSRLTVPFGEPLHIPAPFDCDLDTSTFRAPTEEQATEAP
ncbi:hypothetical protein LHJ74_33585 [Streptomyces sp. N2-109]|uniref:Uncharacterized protein n=1 Tax=Streptomyces gossypii TaxID=2883101 RepID=A0ABT2K3P5_9ACTN|nr:hypothetical protein [Streptomyces gossypii]MCT2594787.1 hypothetical protein [Streptomyces gossypii]